MWRGGNDHENLSGDSRQTSGQSAAFTLIDLLVVILLVFVTLAIILPGLNGGSREAARRMTCTNQIKQIGLAVHNYAQANRVFPPGTICSTAPTAPANQYDVWGEAGKTEAGFFGTSLLLRLLPYVEMDKTYEQWNFNYGVGYNAENGKKPATCEIKTFYCPTRRSGFRTGNDESMMLSKTWTSGGTDYGGCAGRHAAFTSETEYNLCDASMVYSPAFLPIAKGDPKSLKKPKRMTQKRNAGASLDE